MTIPHSLPAVPLAAQAKAPDAFLLPAFVATLQHGALA